jgi:thiol:disulfide interchange protein DsbD
MKLRFHFLARLMATIAFLPLVAMADGLSMRSPFGVNVSTNLVNGMPTLKVDFTVPSECVLYAERLHFLNEEGTELTPRHIPTPMILVDKVTGHEKKLYDRNFAVLLDPVAGSLLVKFQGCTNAACFFPERRTFTVNKAGLYSEIKVTATELVNVEQDPAEPSSDWKTPAKDFQVTARETGYIKASDFVLFLNQAVSGHMQAANDPLAKYKRFGLVATLCLILLGGLGLNLTPCVLPLIPINLAIIGAGKAAHSRSQGFLHGAAYGLGMSLAYGVLGLAVVLTGAKFGTLNSSIWFNVAIALIFLVLSLAMFDVFHIDFQRFDRLLGKRESKVAHQTRSKWLVAFTLGVVAALLAGACVAPVVISVLLMATDMHAKGMAIGLALPFLLGVGMALPWPFMGASLSFLPKPGKWMVWVKYTFGVAIILFALYYGNIAYGLFRSQHPQTSLATAPGSAQLIEGGDQTLAKALQEAQAMGKPVFVDFAASWCKNCEAMDFTVFNQSNVQRRLKDFIVVRYQAERPNDLPARDVLDYFKVLGLPTYLVLSSK